MNGDLLMAKVFAGYAKAALRVGRDYAVYRSPDAILPLYLANQVATIKAAFTIHDQKNFSFDKPSDYDKPLFHALADLTQLQVADYLVGPDGTFFIAEITSSMPCLAVACNTTVSVYAPGPQNVVAGLSGYGGTTQANQAEIVRQAPASLLVRRSMRDSYLPTDSGLGSFRLLLPPFPNISTIRAGSIIVDALGNRYGAQSAELQSLGWRLDVQQIVT